MRRIALTVVVLLIALGGGIASANVIGRGEPPPRPPEPPERLIVPPPKPIPPPPRPRDAVDELLDDLEIGPADGYRDLTIFPLRRRSGSARLRALTFDEALRRGDLMVREQGSGSVNEVQVRNDGRQHVFLMSGEVLTGARQDRIFRDDVLVPPRSGWLPVAVYCVEQGRWTPVSESFRSEKRLAAPRLRQQAQMKAPQSRVWAEVDEVASDNAALQGPTKRFNEVYAAPNVSGKLSAYRDHYVPAPWRGAVGVVVLSHGRILGADIFSDDDLFEELWPKVLESYALDARRVGPKWGSSTEPIRRFLRGARSDRASRNEVATPGVGELLRISGRTSGSALTYRGEAVHVNLYGEPIFVPLRD